MDKTVALLSNIQRYSIHDGGGVRTTLFLKGCPLHCYWCANPENQVFENQLLHFAGKCSHCRCCVQACPTGAAHLEADAGPVFDRERCTLCGNCAQACPDSAVRLAARLYTPQEALDLCLRDAAFYRKTGGVTLSGGEPLSFAGFCIAFAELCRENGIGVVFETCGYGAQETLLQYAALAQGIFFDLKQADPQKHARATGADNSKILCNFRRLTALYDHTTVRVPVIPGLNDTPEEMSEIAACIQANVGTRGIRSIELLPFHNLGLSKYAALDLPYSLSDHTNMEKEHARGYLPLFAQTGFPCVVK